MLTSYSINNGTISVTPTLAARHICGFRHIFAVDPGFVVDPGYSRPPDQPH